MVAINVAAAPHLFEPITPPQWLITFMLAGFAVYLFDNFADKIPGVSSLPDILVKIVTLLALAGAITALQDTKLLGSLSQSMVDLTSKWGAGFNIGGTIVAIAFVGWLGYRYIGSEKIFWDGMFFAIAVMGLAILIPAVAWGTEFLRFSLVTGVQNIILIGVQWLGERSVS